MITSKELKIIKKLLNIAHDPWYICFGCFSTSKREKCHWEKGCGNNTLCKLISSQTPEFKEYRNFISWRDEKE